MTSKGDGLLRSNLPLGDGLLRSNLPLGDGLLRSNLPLGDTILRGASYFVTEHRWVQPEHNSEPGTPSQFSGEVGSTGGPAGR